MGRLHLLELDLPAKGPKVGDDPRHPDVVIAIGLGRGDHRRLPPRRDRLHRGELRPRERCLRVGADRRTLACIVRHGRALGHGESPPRGLQVLG
ncbi:MAG: hypothetical protein ACK559_02580, partial [bacterium]